MELLLTIGSALAIFFHSNGLLFPFNLFAWLLPSFFYGFFEEAGWRGFALPSLQKKYSAIISTAILTIFWAGWHIPSFFYRYNMNVGALIGFILGLFAGAILLTFIFNYSKGSIIAVSTWHLTYNLTSVICKEGMIPAIVSTLIIVLAIAVLITYKGKDLSPFERITWKISGQPLT